MNLFEDLLKNLALCYPDKSLIELFLQCSKLGFTGLLLCSSVKNGDESFYKKKVRMKTAGRKERKRGPNWISLT